MNASIKIEVSDFLGNRASVEMVGHENQLVGSFSDEAEEIALKLLQAVQAGSRKTPEAKS